MNDKKENSEITFNELGIDSAILKILEKFDFKKPTPIQQKAIPAGISGVDIVGVSQTGTGKTIAFMIPIIQRLSKSKGKALILVPTRELAVQVAEVYRMFESFVQSSVSILIGGEHIEKQMEQLERNPRIIIATPGRLIDHLNQHLLTLLNVEMLVLDEADRMFDMGFLPQIEKIFSFLPSERQTMLFSATMPEEVMKLASKHMKMPVRVEVARSATAPEKVIQELFFVEESAKLSLLNSLLDKYSKTVLIFVRTRNQAARINSALRELGHNCAEIHSDRTLSQRFSAMEGFKSGKYRILVATDIAARGIDVDDIELVINYELPDEEENYVHRIGRTGRAGQAGHAITFASPDQMKDVSRIEKLIRMRIKSSALPPLKPLRRMPKSTQSLKNDKNSLSAMHGKNDRKSFYENRDKRQERFSKSRQKNNHKSSHKTGYPLPFQMKSTSKTNLSQKSVANEMAHRDDKLPKNSHRLDASPKKRGIIHSFIRRIVGRKDEG